MRDKNNNISAIQPLISIITVVYNGENCLEKAIKSVIGQSYHNIEYIIIDGCSKDNTINIIKKWEHKISYWVSEKDEGIYHAINKGIAKACGELVGIINSDDWYEIDTIKIIVEHYLAHPNYDVYYGLARFWDSPQHLMSVQGYTHKFLKQGMISHPSCFIKKSSYDHYGIFDSKYRIAADYNLMLSFLLEGAQFFFIERVLANFMAGGASTISSFYREAEVLDIKRRYLLISRKKYLIKKIFLRIRSIFSI